MRIITGAHCACAAAAVSGSTAGSEAGDAAVGAVEALGESLVSR